MKHGWLPILALIGLAALLGLLLWLAPGSDADTPPALSATAPAQVRQITLERPGQDAIELERRDAQWRIRAPLSARADEFQVQRMLALLEAKPDARLPATDLDRFDLLSPVARLTIDGTEYAFGGINTVTREQYVMRGDTVYALGLRHGAALPASALALIRRVLLEEHEIPAAIHLPEFRVRQSAGRWAIDPASVAAGPDELQQFIDRWRQASAARAEPHDGRPALAEVRIELREGAPLAISVLQQVPQLVLLRQDQGLQYTFLTGAGEALLTHPGKPRNTQ
ncbi:MAG: DUF4340 domain-containing protein [Burkholderiales bacterium]|nr:DUF4340 domain-containing protein [Burkholderiales bacterium]MDP2397925.1 DUF4340 domain-containing protein [Burkholderiales bacterium]